MNQTRRSRKRNPKKWKRSDSFESDSISLGRELCYDCDSDYDPEFDFIACENQRRRTIVDFENLRFEAI